MARPSFAEGTVCTQKRGRYIKLAGERVRYSRHLGEINRGPVPNGFTVAPIDGDPENDSLGNLTLARAGDMFLIAEERKPDRFEKGRARRSERLRAANINRGVVGRSFRLVVEGRRQAVPDPAGRRRRPSTASPGRHTRVIASRLLRPSCDMHSAPRQSMPTGEATDFPGSQPLTGTRVSKVGGCSKSPSAGD